MSKIPDLDGKPVFTIWNPETGQFIEIYVDGTVEGVKGSFVMFNRIPLLIDKAIAEFQANFVNQA